MAESNVTPMHARGQPDRLPVPWSGPDQYLGWHREMAEWITVALGADDVAPVTLVLSPEAASEVRAALLWYGRHIGTDPLFPPEHPSAA